jgi:hypothetical protein
MRHGYAVAVDIGALRHATGGAGDGDGIGRNKGRHVKLLGLEGKRVPAT